MEKARRERMTPDIVRAELARVHDIPLPEDDFERRVETRRRESLERILARWEGEEPKPRIPTQPLVPGELNPLSTLVREAV